MDRTLGELAAQSDAALRVLDRFGLDFCCGGARLLSEACREKGLDPGEVLAQIETASNGDREAAGDWREAPLDSLIDHIVTRHHAYLRDELPRLDGWLAAVRRAHGARDGKLLDELGAAFTAMKDELEAHLAKEEAVLFPAIRRSDGWIAQPVSVMEHEHESAGRSLAELRRITGGYEPPPHACQTYRALYAGLAALERDLHRHIHLENNILFPRALADTERGRGC